VAGIGCSLCRTLLTCGPSGWTHIWPLIILGWTGRPVVCVGNPADCAFWCFLAFGTTCDGPFRANPIHHTPVNTRSGHNSNHHTPPHRCVLQSTQHRKNPPMTNTKPEFWWRCTVCADQHHHTWKEFRTQTMVAHRDARHPGMIVTFLTWELTDPETVTIGYRS